MVEELWDKQPIRESEGLFQHVQVSLSRNWTPHNQPEKEKWVTFLIGIISGGCTVCHWLMPFCTKQGTLKPVSDWLPGFVLWLLAGRTVDFLINHQKVGSSSRACAAEALSHTTFCSESLSDHCERGWSLAKKRRYHTGAFIDWSHCTGKLLITAVWRSSHPCVCA